MILWPAAALSAWGNVELFGGSTLLSMGIVLMAAIGLEIGMMALIVLGARERSMRAAALSVGACLLLLSLMGQYAFLLSRASGHEEHVAQATRTEHDASADQAAARQELATVQAALAKEQESGWGPKAQALAARADALRAKVESLSAVMHEAVETHTHRSPLLVLTERFHLDSDTTLKVASALFLLGVNVAGFLLLFAASRDDGEEGPVVPVTKPQTNGHHHAEVEAAPVVPVTARGVAALFEPAPEWLQEARSHLQGRCGTKALRRRAALGGGAA